MRKPRAPVTFHPQQIHSRRLASKKSSDGYRGYIRTGGYNSWVKLKYALPLAQMAIAVVLLRWSNLWWEAMRRHMDMPPPAPASTFLISMNLPIALARRFWVLSVSEFWDNVLLVVTIGLLWYWIALSINSWRRQRSMVWFKWLPLRIVADVAVIIVCGGLGFLVAASLVTNMPSTPLFQLEWTWLVLTWVALFFWTFGSIFIFGYDLVHCFLRKSRQTASPAHLS
jgi:hypothetical protein